MKTLCMDTAHKNLIVGLYENDRRVCGIAKEAWKRQSEDLFPAIVECMEKAGWDSMDLDEVVITDGPGSYTGVRIAMTVAKVLCTRLHLPLYTISTLQLYAGLDEEALVLMDARSHRAYVGILEEGRFLRKPCAMPLAEIEQLAAQGGYHYYGDAQLIGKSALPSDYLDNFIALRPCYQRVENIHTLTPAYLKDQSAYQVKTR